MEYEVLYAKFMVKTLSIFKRHFFTMLMHILYIMHFLTLFFQE